MTVPRLELILADDGEARVEVHTGDPIGVTWWGGRPVPPESFLRGGLSSWGPLLHVSGRVGSDANGAVNLKRTIDLSSVGERAFAEAVLRQDAVGFSWPADGIVDQADATPIRNSWRASLDASVGMTAVAFRELRVEHGELPPRRRRIVDVPRPGAVPFFAERVGRLPRAARPTIAGQRLPEGRRFREFWRTDAPVPDALALADRLIQAFPATGLWPVLWGWPDEPPDAYCHGAIDLRTIETDPAAVLRAASEDPFPGLAPGNPPGAVSIADIAEPLELLQAEQGIAAEWSLLLVPCNRPGDALAVLGHEFCTGFTPAQLASVTRSWEERFSAVLVALDPTLTVFAVGAPPRSSEQALGLEAELSAAAPTQFEEITAGLARRAVWPLVLREA